MAHPSQDQIPQELHQQLQDFRRHLWRGKLLEALLAGVVGLLISFLVVFLLDRAMATPGWLRLAILIAGTSLFTFFAPYWIHRWILKHRRENELARLISRKFPRTRRPPPGRPRTLQTRRIRRRSLASPPPGRDCRCRPGRFSTQFR